MLTGPYDMQCDLWSVGVIVRHRAALTLALNPRGSNPSPNPCGSNPSPSPTPHPISLPLTLTQVYFMLCGYLPFVGKTDGEKAHTILALAPPWP